jgi:hypothetical protein
MSFVLMVWRWQPCRMMTTVSLRLATSADRPQLDLLAALDSARPLDGAVLVAEADGSLRAARSLRDGRTIADPFAPAADLVVLLAARAALLRGAPSQRSRGPSGLHRLLQERLAPR